MTTPAPEHEFYDEHLESLKDRVWQSMVHDFGDPRSDSFGSLVNTLATV